MPGITLPDGALGDQSLELRAVSEADVAAFVAAFQDPAIAEGAYRGKLAGTEDELRPYLARNAERMESGEAVLLAIWEEGARRLSGQTMLFRIEQEDGTAELGFWTAPWARGRGLAARALRLTVAFGFDHLGIERIYGITGLDNRPAQRAMEGVGMQREGVLRGLAKIPEGRLDQVCFAILVTDPRTFDPI